MLKNLQLYTICIVILVIVLSQISIFIDNDKLSFNSSGKNVNQIGSSDNDDNSFFNAIKNSKYGEPLVEISRFIDNINQSKKKINNSVEDLTNILDIEKSLNELHSIME